MLKFCLLVAACMGAAPATNTSVSDTETSAAQPALHIAVQRLDVERVQALLQDGASITQLDLTGATPLHAAAAAGPGGREVDAILERIVEMLLDAGADVNARDSSGATPLRFATDRGHERVAAALRARGGVALPTEPPLMLRGTYRMYADIGPILQTAETNYPAICRRYDLGLSVEGRHIWALLITDNPDVEEDEPEFRYVSTMHGNEWLGTEMCLYYIDYLTSNYGSNSRVTNIVDNVELWIVPLMNPDGHEAPSPTRNNAQGIDLNRDFPDVYFNSANNTVGRAPETAAIMNWCAGRSFAAAANLHTGALVTVYPFDGNAEYASIDTPTPDDDLFEWTSREYSQHNSAMFNSMVFDDGVVNGADWYAVFGSLQDWSYRYMGTNEMTIELSNPYIPPQGQLESYWNANRESMLSTVETCLIGVRGLTTDEITAAPVASTLTVNGIDHAVYADPDVGDYHRLLLPGTYDLRFEAKGYDPVAVEGVVVASGNATVHDVAMPQTAAVVYPNGGEMLTAGQPITVSWTGSPNASFQVQYTNDATNVPTNFDGFEGGISIDYQVGGDANWFATTDDAFEGAFAARSGVIGANDTTWMSRTIVTTGETEIRFWYRVSSEGGYDYFRFLVNDEIRIQTSGESGWLEYVETLGAGTHELQWEYAKDGAAAEGSDQAWVDGFEFTEDNVTWTDIVALTPPGATSTAWMPTADGGDYAIRVRAIYDSGVDGYWDTSNTVFEVAPGLGGDFDFDGDVDLSDFAQFSLCFGGANVPPAASCPPGVDADLDDDGDVDLTDFSEFSLNFTGPL